MCLVVMDGEVKKGCCNCSSSCKRVQKQSEKWNQLNERNETVDLTVFLQKSPALQYQHGLMNGAAYYEKSNHF